ncbi:MAG: hydrogenase nickel incorporation protein HypB [Thermoplasmata archaeon]
MRKIKKLEKGGKMHQTVDVNLGANILSANLRIAERNRMLLRKHGIKSVDFMGSIGSGKTLLIENIVEKLKAKNKRCAVIAGDVAGDDDYKRFKKHGVEAVNVNTDKECHLDAHLIDHALEKIDLKNIDVLFIENVGNLVCPADFPLGTDERVVVISVTEGDDMVRKHPTIFAVSPIIVINKIDLAKYMEVEPDILENDARKINPHAKIIKTDAKHSVGIDELMNALGV